MQATCENCGKTITPDDFRAGLYFLFWITPTIPSESLYLCQACRGLSWEEREALFDAWWVRRHGASQAETRKPQKKRRAAGKTASKAATNRTAPARAKPSRKRPTAQNPKSKPVSKPAAKPERSPAETPWWENETEREQRLKQLAQMAFNLSR